MGEFTGADQLDPSPRKIRLGEAFLITAGLAAACCAVFAISASLLVDFNLTGSQTTCSPEQQATLERQAGLEFPPGASNIDCGYIFLQGSEAWARFEMPPGELETFLASTYVTSVSAQPIPAQAKFRYNTHAVTDYLYGDGSFVDGRFGANQYILIDTSDPNRYVVYFQTWFGD